MIQVCEGKDTNAYRNAQAVANDIVFEYQDELPKNTGYVQGQNQIFLNKVACFEISIFLSSHFA